MSPINDMSIALHETPVECQEKAIDPWEIPRKTLVTEMRGYIDKIEAGALYGWCYSGQPGSCQQLFVYVDNELLTTILADQYRADLDQADLNNGVCAFIWQIPEHLRDGCDHVIHVRTKSGIELKKSPCYIKGGLDTKGVPAEMPETFQIMSVDLSNILTNPLLEGMSTKRCTAEKGANLIARDWELYVDSSDVGAVSCWQSLIDPFDSGDVSNSLRFRSIKSIKLARLIANFHNINCFFVLPFNLSFCLKNLNSSVPVMLNVRIGTKKTDGKLTYLYKSTVHQGGNFCGDISLAIPADLINKAAANDEHTPVVIFEFIGNTNVELGCFKLGIGTTPLTIMPNTGLLFEDPVIENQYKNIKAFFGIEIPLGNESEMPKWRSWPAQKLVEIIVPVYDALDHVQACLTSIAQSINCPYLLTIIDDGSMPECAAWLDCFAKDKPWVRVLHNTDNIGYTRTINRAIRESTGSAVVLLNSDTIVPTDWLPRLMTVADSDPKTGIVGPLSNAASWQSVPLIKDEAGAWAINCLPKRMTVDEMDEMVRSESSGEFPEVPVLNGFCLFIKRAVFDTIGLFDEEAFPEGYGEENDFCFRAVDAGFTLRIATDTYVYHAKTKSFGSERRSQLVGNANTVLHARYGKERFSRLENELAKQTILNDMRIKLQQLIASKEHGNHG